MTTAFVLDASAILAVSYGEKGRDQVIAALPRSQISAINLAEAISDMIRMGFDPYDVERQVAGLPPRVIDFDRGLAIQTGLLRRITVPRGLSLGDRACIALAMREKLPVMTADRVWTDLDLPVEVVLIR